MIDYDFGAAVAGQPLLSAMVAEQSAPIAGQSPSFGCPVLPPFAAVAGQPLPSAPVAAQSASVARTLPSLSASKHKSPPLDCWWSDVLDMEIKGYVDLSDKLGNTVLCLYAETVRERVMVLSLYAGHFLSTIGMDMRMVTNIKTY